MPELGQLRGYGLPVTQYQPRVIQYGAPPRVVPDLSGAARIQGASATLGIVADTLAKLPAAFRAGQKEGQRAEEEDAAHAFKMAALGGGDKALLSDFVFGAGDVNPLWQSADETYNAHRGGWGKVTSYGYQSDPLGDSASLGKGAFKVPTGAWDNPLTEDSFSASPDVEAALLKQGVKPGDYAALQLDDGTLINRKWDDRTMQDADAVKKFGAPLRGRFDFYSPGGVHALDGRKVVGLRPTGALAAPMAQPPGAAEPGGLPAPDAETPIGPLGGRIAQIGGGLYREEFDDGRVATYPRATKGGRPVVTWAQKPAADHTKAEALPATIKTEMAESGYNPFGKTAKAALDEWQTKLLDSGVIPKHLIPAAQRVQQRAENSRVVRDYAIAIGAKSTIDSAVENPDTEGFGDMAIIEGFQRMVNPGAVVRVSTIDQMQQAVGLLQKYNPFFVWDRITDGVKLTDEARGRIKKLADIEYAKLKTHADVRLRGIKKELEVYGVSPAAVEKLTENALAQMDITDGGATAAPAGTTPGAAPAALPPGASGAQRVATQAEFDALPSGAWFIDDSGTPKQKR